MLSGKGGLPNPEPNRFLGVNHLFLTDTTTCLYIIHDCLLLWVSLSLEQFLWRALEGPSLQSGTTDPVLVPWLHSMKLENSQNHTSGACRGQDLSRVHQPKLVADMKRYDYLEFIELYNYKLFLVMYTTWCNPHLGKMAGKVTLLRIH